MAAEFAQVEDIAARLGRDLTEQEETSAVSLILGASAVILAELDRDDAWGEALDPVPSFVKEVCTSIVVRSLSNPSQLATYDESLGAYSYSQRFFNGAEAMMLTPVEALLLRRNIYGSNSASSRPASTFDDLIEYAETGALEE